MDAAAADIQSFVEGMDGDAYAGDALRQAAVERKFATIGEALANLRKFHPELAERIPRSRDIVAFRNLLIHEYARVSPRFVWDAVENRLPELRRAVQELLVELGPPER